MKKVFYVGIALLVYVVAAIGTYGCFRFHSWHFGILTALSLLGLVPFTLTAVRSLRGLPVDDRLITIWAWCSVGISTLFRFSEKKGAVELVLGVLTLGIGLVSLVRFLSNPKPAPPDPAREPIPIPSELGVRSDSSESIGCAFGFGFLLLIAAPVSQFFIHPRSLLVMVTLAAIGLTLMLGGAIFGRRRTS